MKLILKEDVAGLGYKDDVVEVKNGYGRNYLIPTGRGVIATPSALKVLAENLRQRAHKLAQLKADAEALAEALKDVKLSIATKVSETGTIFGSVNAAQIAEALKEAGHENRPQTHRAQATRQGSGQLHCYCEYLQRSQRRNSLRSCCRIIL